MPGFSTIFERLKLSGPRNHRFAEEIDMQRDKVIDLSDPQYNNVATSVDCYVSGRYTDAKGNTIEIKQRYTVYVSYHRLSLTQAIAALRKQIVDDYQQKYPGFSLDEVFIPQMIAPIGQQGMMADEGFYFGSKLFRELSRKQNLNIHIGTAADLYKRNVDTLRKRYQA